MPGLLGVALSGAGPSVVALATGRHDEIAKAIAQCFERHDLTPVVRNMEAAQEGLVSTQKYISVK
jgi:homoserine kinase